MFVQAFVASHGKQSVSREEPLFYLVTRISLSLGLGLGLGVYFGCSNSSGAIMLLFSFAKQSVVVAFVAAFDE